MRAIDLRSVPPLSRKPPPGQYELWRYCLRKEGYTRNNARMMRDMRNQNLADGERPYAIYRCENCRRWHLGHLPK